jgi:hypothetical protein
MTFRAGIPPHHLAEMTVLQIVAHLDYLKAVNGDG